jgi:primosomal protein N'
MQRRLKKQVKSNTTIDPNTGEIKPVNNESEYLATSVKLTSQQLTVLADMDSHDGPFLLYGATSSGKTEVYLQAANKVLRSDKKAQVLVESSDDSNALEGFAENGSEFVHQFLEFFE